MAALVDRAGVGTTEQPHALVQGQRRCGSRAAQRSCAARHEHANSALRRVDDPLSVQLGVVGLSESAPRKRWLSFQPERCSSARALGLVFAAQRVGLAELLHSGHEHTVQHAYAQMIREARSSALSASRVSLRRSARQPRRAAAALGPRARRTARLRADNRRNVQLGDVSLSDVAPRERWA